MPDLKDLPTKNLLRVSETAQYFGVSERTIYLWIEHGKLTAEKPSGVIFISRESIKNFRLLGQSENGMDPLEVKPRRGRPKKAK